MDPKENNVIPFPGQPSAETPQSEDIPTAEVWQMSTPEAREDTPEAVVETTDNAETEVVEADGNDEPKDVITDPNNPITKDNEKQLADMVRSAGEIVKMMSQNWDVTRKEFKLTDSQMREFYQWNEQHKTPMPDDLSDEEKEKWDHFNGIDSITDEELLRIFGEGHPIIGVEHAQTMDRVKPAVEDFFNYLSALREYRNIHDAYLQLVEYNEELEIKKLQYIMEKETDPDKKQAMQASLDEYYSKKYLDFLKEPLEENDINRIVRAFHTERTIEYWLKRGRDKLKQLKISQMFIPEISQFEKRFLDKKYHKLSNMFLLYFLSLIIFADCYDKKNPSRAKGIAIVIAMDNFIRGQMSGETKDRIKENVSVFLDQFLDRVEDPESEKPVESDPQPAPTETTETPAE